MYNYKENVKADIYAELDVSFSWLFENITAEDIKSDPYDAAGRIADELFNCDSVTGNASGSYYCNSWKAREAVIDNIYLLREVCTEWCYENEVAEWFLNENWEAMDVTIRCYLLHEVMCEVMEEIKDAIEGIEDEEMTDAYELAGRLAA